MADTTAADADLVVAGAGVVGVCCALWAALRGQRVILCDPNPPGSGASYGNAGTIATYGVLPVNDPGLFAALPRLLFARDSPLSVNPLHALTHPRWMLSFLSNCRASRVDAISRELAALLGRADAGLNPLLEAAGATDLLVPGGQMTVWSTRAGLAAAQAGLARRRELGVRAEVLDAAQARALEPALRLPIAGAVLFPDARHVRDPAALVARLAACLTDRGGQILSTGVARASPDAQGVTLRLADGTPVRARHMVVAAGAHGTLIPGTGAARLPLDVERGYHLQYADRTGLLSRPVGWAEGGFYATPMAGGLRLAGTVEIAGRHRPPNPARLAYLRRKGRQMFGPLTGPEETWMGLRPSFPDALPAIGPSPASARITLAFGHQHLGLTLGGITGRIVADLSEGRQPNMDIAPYSATRF